MYKTAFHCLCIDCVLGKPLASAKLSKEEPNAMFDCARRYHDMTVSHVTKRRNRPVSIWNPNDHDRHEIEREMASNAGKCFAWTLRSCVHNAACVVAEHVLLNLRSI